MRGSCSAVRTMYSQVEGLPMAAAADRGDQQDAWAVGDGASGARHVARCLRGASVICAQGGRLACGDGVGMREGAYANGLPLPDFQTVVDWVVDGCLAYERERDPGLDLELARGQILRLAPYLERWHGCIAASQGGPRPCFGQ